MEGRGNYMVMLSSEFLLSVGPERTIDVISSYPYCTHDFLMDFFVT